MLEKMSPILYFRLLNEQEEQGQPYIQNDQINHKEMQTLITRSREATDSSEHSDGTL